MPVVLSIHLITVSRYSPKEGMTINFRFSFPIQPNPELGYVTRHAMALKLTENGTKKRLSRVDPLLHAGQVKVAF